MKNKLLGMMMLLASSMASYSMSESEYSAYQQKLHREGSRLGRKFTMPEWEKGIGSQSIAGMNYTLVLNERYKNSRLKQSWQNLGIGVLGAFVEKSPMEIACISDNDALNLLVVQSQHLGLAGRELIDLIEEKCFEVTADQLLKSMLVASFLDSTGECNYYLDQYYLEKIKNSK